MLRRIEFLGSPMDVGTMDDSVAHIDNAISSNYFLQHVVVNVAKLINMRKDCVLADSVKSCDIINIDGMGVVWGARLCGFDVPERVSGIDLFYRILDMSADKNYSVYFLGGTEEVICKTVDVLRLKYVNLNIAGYHHGYFWNNEEEVVADIAESRANILFVAITSPKKENFINRWSSSLGVNFVMGVGGTFDVVSGKVNRAPVWMQKSGLEWLFRVIQEPRRMWWRYTYTNFVYLYLIAVEFIKNKFMQRH